MDKYLVNVSKTISHALRHSPEEYGLTLDPEGWVEVDDLLTALRSRLNARYQISLATIETIMAQAEKQRFELRDGKIRAFYGHSTATKIERAPVEPPALLYHGTTQEAAQAIVREGLRSMKRQYVHLSADTETALRVGLRRTNRPVILRIDALAAYQQGVRFYLGNEDIWMADPIPAHFIHI